MWTSTHQVLRPTNVAPTAIQVARQRHRARGHVRRKLWGQCHICSAFHWAGVRSAHWKGLVLRRKCSLLPWRRVRNAPGEQHSAGVISRGATRGRPLEIATHWIRGGPNQRDRKGLRRRDSWRGREAGYIRAPDTHSDADAGSSVSERKRARFEKQFTCNLPFATGRPKKQKPT